MPMPGDEEAFESEETEFDRAQRARERAEQDQKMKEMHEQMSGIMSNASETALNMMLSAYKTVASDGELVDLVADCTARFVKRLVNEHEIPMEYAVAIAIRQLEKFHSATRSILPVAHVTAVGGGNDPELELDYDDEDDDED